MTGRLREPRPPQGNHHSEPVFLSPGQQQRTTPETEGKTLLITRTETPTGGPNRTRREEIVALNTGPGQVEPEVYLDESESEGWPWESNPNICTWDIQLDALRQLIIPFEQLDSQAATEQAGGDDGKGGVYTYPFSNRHQPMGTGDDDGDLNSANWDEKIGAHIARYFKRGKPRGGTQIMEAVHVADEHFLKEFPGENNRPIRARVVFTDGLLGDADKLRAYLAAGTPAGRYGMHPGDQRGGWREIWAIAIFGEGQTSEGNPGKEAADQYRLLAKDHPWIHVYNFEQVTNPAEIAEDMALAVVPVQA